MRALLPGQEADFEALARLLVDERGPVQVRVEIICERCGALVADVREMPDKDGGRLPDGLGTLLALRHRQDAIKVSGTIEGGGRWISAGWGPYVFLERPGSQLPATIPLWCPTASHGDSTVPTEQVRRALLVPRKDRSVQRLRV